MGAGDAFMPAALSAGGRAAWKAACSPELSSSHHITWETHGISLPLPPVIVSNGARLQSAPTAPTFEFRVLPSKRAEKLRGFPGVRFPELNHLLTRSGF